MSDTLVTILEIPIAVRAGISMFVIWGIYALMSGLLVKTIMLVPLLFNWIWSLVYTIVNCLTHILHRKFGQSFAGVDQTITDFFGGVYGFVDKIKTTIEMTRETKRPFTGIVFLILTVLTVWIALPTWLHVERDMNLFTAPHRKYIEIENKALDMVFSRDIN